MYNTNDWFYFTEGLDKKTCNKIRNSAKGKWEESEVDTKKGEFTVKERITGRKQISDIDKKVRISDVVWITEQWIYDLIWKYMLAANEQAGWKYDMVAAESCQVTRYTKDGEVCNRDKQPDCKSGVA